MKLARPRPARGAYLVVTFMVLLMTVFATFIFGRTYEALSLEKAPFGRLAYVPAFDPIEDATLGIPMDSGNRATVDPPRASIRVMEVYPTQIVMLAGGKAARVINLHTPVTTLRQLVQTVNDPAWLVESGTHVTMLAGVIMELGTALTIEAPVTTEVTMKVAQGVMLAGAGAHLNLTGVYIHASDSKTPAAGSRVAVRTDLGRPLILATQATIMNITDSKLQWLGRDWNSSYGTVWTKGSTGTVTNTTFDHDFIGVYSDHAVGLSVTNSKFFHNSLYGVDPHSYSKELVITGNDSEYNGRHGIIFSDHVSDSVVRNNVTKYNGLNGIMMDEVSAGNVIANNTSIGNRSDGIVMANSSGNSITGNIVRDNRVGIHIRGVSSNNTVAGNTVTGNRVAGQGTSLAGNTVENNGGQWELGRMVVVWAIAAFLLLLLYGATFISYRIPGKKRLGSTAKLAVATA